jgi:hypothetical protein
MPPLSSFHEVFEIYPAIPITTPDQSLPWPGGSDNLFGPLIFMGYKQDGRKAGVYVINKQRFDHS